MRQRRISATLAIAVLVLTIPIFTVLPLAGTAAVPPVSAQSAQADEVQLELVAQIGGVVSAVFVEGNHAYVGVGPHLVILDISDPVNPTEVGRTNVLPSFVLDVQVAGDYAYVVDRWSSSLRVISVADKTKPMEVGYYDLPGDAQGVAVAGDYAYVANRWSGLRVISVADKTHPVEVGYYDTPGKAQGVAVAGDYVYVANSESGLRVISVADKAHPAEVGFYDTPGDALDVAVVGDYAYVADDHKGLRVISVADKAHPAEVGFYDTPGYAMDVAVAGDYAYVADEHKGLRVISVADKAHPVEAGFTDTPGYAYEVAVAGDYAYVLHRSGLRVISVADKAKPMKAGCYNTPRYAWGVVVSGDYVYVADADSWLRVISVADKVHPVQTGSYAPRGGAMAVAVAEDYAWGACDDTRGGAMAVAVAGDYVWGAYQGDVVVAGDYAYVTDWLSGLRVISVADKAHPVWVGHYDTPGDAYGVAVAGDYAFVADGLSGLQVISLADKAHPVRVGHYDTPGDAWDVAVAGDYAYVADRKRGLRVISVADKAHPVEVGYYDTPDEAFGVAVAGDYAFVADDDKGLRVISVADKAHPAEVGFYDTPGYAMDVAVAGDYAFVANENEGLFIFRITWAGMLPTPTATPAWESLPLTAKQDTINFLSGPTFTMINLPDIHGPGYDERGAAVLLDQVRSQHEGGTLDPILASGFQRLKLQEDVIRTTYSVYVVTADDLNDTTISIFGLILDIMDATRRAVAPLGELAHQILEVIIELLSDVLNDWIQAHSGIGPGWKTSATILLDHMKGMASPRSSASGGLRLPADERMTRSFVNDTQPIIDRAVAAARNPSTFADSNDQQAADEIAARLTTLSEAAARRHGILEGAKDVLHAYEKAWLPMLGAGKLGQIVVLVNEAIAAFTELHLTTTATARNVADMQVLLRDSQTITFPWAPSVAISAADRQTPRAGVLAASADLSDWRPISSGAKRAGGTAHLSGRRAHLQDAITTYEDVLRRALEAVEAGDAEALATLLPELMAAQREVSAQFKVNRAPLLAAEPGDEAVAQVYADSSAYSFSNVALYLALLDFLADPANADAQRRTAELGQVVLTATGNYEEAVDTVRTVVTGLPIPPHVIIASVTLPEDITVGQGFDLNVTLGNTGPTPAADVTVRLTGGDVIPADETQTLGEIAGAASQAVTFHLTPSGAGAEILTLEVTSSNALMSSRSIYVAVEKTAQMPEASATRLPEEPEEGPPARATVAPADTPTPLRKIIPPCSLPLIGGMGAVVVLCAIKLVVTRKP